MKTNNNFGPIIDDLTFLDLKIISNDLHFPALKDTNPVDYNLDAFDPLGCVKYPSWWVKNGEDVYATDGRRLWYQTVQSIIGEEGKRNSFYYSAGDVTLGYEKELKKCLDYKITYYAYKDPDEDKPIV